MTFGVIALAVFVYVLAMHVLLLAGAASGVPLFSFRMTPLMGVVHGLIVIVAAGLGLGFCYHILFRNHYLTLQHRVFWVFAVAIGYGQVFYWYRHLLHPGLMAAANKPMHGSGEAGRI